MGLPTGPCGHPCDQSGGRRVTEAGGPRRLSERPLGRDGTGSWSPAEFSPASGPPSQVPALSVLEAKSPGCGREARSPQGPAVQGEKREEDEASGPHAAPPSALTALRYEEKPPQ